MGLKWLITGGCGFIGTCLIRELVAEGGHAIRVVDNLSVGTREDLVQVCDFKEVDLSRLSSLGTPHSSDIVELIVGDILDDQLALHAAKGTEVIVHLAANTGVAPSVEDPRSDCLNNVIGTLNYLEGARHNQVKRFIFASSGAPIGECEPPIHEKMVPHPVSPYGASKLSGEGYCSAYFRSFGIETVCLRFGNVYGPSSGHKNSVVAKFIKRAMNGEVLEIYGDGNQTRDYIYIDDLVKAIRLSASQEGVGGEVFQIATNEETTLTELVKQLLPVLADAGVDHVEVRHAASRQGDVRRNFSDTSKARTVLNWQAEMELEEGLRRTAEWFHQNKSVGDDIWKD
jgi:UDP-glucose 4-epimerase